MGEGEMGERDRGEADPQHGARRLGNFARMGNSALGESVAIFGILHCI